MVGMTLFPIVIERDNNKEGDGNTEVLGIPKYTIVEIKILNPGLSNLLTKFDLESIIKTIKIPKEKVNESSK